MKTTSVFSNKINIIITRIVGGSSGGEACLISGTGSVVGIVLIF